MTQNQLSEALRALSLPLAYHSFKARVKPPYLAYFAVKSKTANADNAVVACTLTTYQVELYTEFKDVRSETRVEQVLEGCGLAYEKSESYIKEDDIYQIVYEIELIEMER